MALASILVYVARRHCRHIHLVLNALWPKQPLWMSRIAFDYEIEIRGMRKAPPQEGTQLNEH